MIERLDSHSQELQSPTSYLLKGFIPNTHSRDIPRPAGCMISPLKFEMAP